MRVMRAAVVVVVVVVAGMTVGACAATGGKATSPAYSPPANEMTETSPAPAPEPESTGVADGRGYCNIPHRGMCSEFPADSYDSGRELCTQHGTWSDYGCPTENVLGYCTNPEQGGGAVLTLYGGSTYSTAEQAAADKCSDAGDVFTPAY